MGTGRCWINVETVNWNSSNHHSQATSQVSVLVNREATVFVAGLLAPLDCMLLYCHGRALRVSIRTLTGPGANLGCHPTSIILTSPPAIEFCFEVAVRFYIG